MASSKFPPASQATQREFIHSAGLRNLKPKQGKMIFHCPTPGCGRKDAAFIWNRTKGEYIGNCYGCRSIGALSWFLHNHDPALLKSYNAASREERGGPVNVNPLSLMGLSEPEPEARPEKAAWVATAAIEMPGGGAYPILELEGDHVAIMYMRERGFTDEMLKYIFYVDDWYAFHLHYAFEPPREQGEWRKPRPRIVIPFWDRSKKIAFVQGRALPGDNHPAKYISFRVRGFDWDAEVPPIKAWGLWKIRTRMMIPVFEGPFDAMFVINSLAMAGLGINEHNLAHLLGLQKRMHRFVYILDNELWIPSLAQLARKYGSVESIPENIRIRHDKGISLRAKHLKLLWGKIESGCRVVLWDKGIKQKDLNSMITEGGHPPDLWESMIFTPEAATKRLTELGLTLDGIEQVTRDAETRITKRKEAKREARRK